MDNVKGIPIMKFDGTIHEDYTNKGYTKMTKGDEDFRVGDVVCTAVNGTGKVEAVQDNGGAVSVAFGGGCGATFSCNGFHDPMQIHPSLFHGKYEDVFTITEQKPKRVVYVNLHRQLDGSILVGSQYCSEDIAKKDALRHDGTMYQSVVAVAIAIDAPE